MLTKRGGRAGMVAIDGTVGVETIYLKHGQDGLSWDKIEDPEKEEKAEKRKPKPAPPSGFLHLLPDRFTYKEGVLALVHGDVQTPIQAKRNLGNMTKDRLIMREPDGTFVKVGKEMNPELT